MATNFWLGTVQAVAGVRKVVIGGTAAATDTVTLTVTGSGKFVKHTVPTGGQTPAEVASALLNLWNGSADGEIREISAVLDPLDSTAILFTGPADGATIAIASTETGTVTATDSSLTTEAGPHDAANVANYSSGALPGAGDTLVFRDAINGPKYNLTALAAIALNVVQRYATFLGQWGLPEYDAANGYRQYRARYLQMDTDLMQFEASPNDGAEQFLWQSMNAALTATRVFGQTNPAGGSPSLELFGTVGASTLHAAGGSIGVALRKSQASVFTVVDVTDSRLDAGDGVTNLGAVTLNNVTGTVEAAAYTTWNQFGTSDITIRRATAAGTSTAVNGGTLRWNSSGTPNTTDVAGGAVFDLSFAPVDLAAVNVRQHRGSTFLNPAGRITSPWTHTHVNCGPQDVVYVGPPGEVLTVN